MKIGIMYTDFTNTSYKYSILSFTESLYQQVINYVTSFKNTKKENINNMLLFFHNYLSYYAYRQNCKADIYKIEGLYLFYVDRYYKIQNPINSNLLTINLSKFELDMLANNFFRKSIQNSWKVFNNKTKVKHVLNDDQFNISLVASKYYYSFQYSEFINYKFY